MISRSVVLTVGVLFHLIYLRSIFDIYFKSPVVSVDNQYLTTIQDIAIDSQPTISPADRLFLIVGDGLRADKLFENPQLAPFLHDRALQDGRWGISHTRVPTESRPGHVALIAGLYEDVSAVTTGWTLNPVKFDSVFNQSRKTWAWGSPDILPMFREGASDRERMSCDMYDPEKEDFTKDNEKLDTWVFEHVDAFFERALTDVTLAEDLRKDKNVFFLHLLGLDSAGHGHRPYSPEYLNNIAVVDKGIAHLMDTLRSFYGPEGMARTAFLFTADHGMSDWGSHGDGHPNNTRTPYIAWGSGINPPASHDPSKISPSRSIHHTAHESLGWLVEDRERVDVAQADLAVLMSYLVGVPFPKNNVGSIPVDLLSANSQTTAIASFQNARQIHAQYSSKAKYKADLLHVSKMVHFSFSKDYFRAGLELIRSEQWSGLQTLSEAWTLESLNGMRYLQRYDWFFLRSVVTLGYIGWMLFALSFVLNSYVLPYTPAGQASQKDERIGALMGPKIVPGSIANNAQGIPTLLEPIDDSTPSRTTKLVFSAVGATTLAYLLERSAPISYYAYAAFPIFFWYCVISDLPQLVESVRKFSTTSNDLLFPGLGVSFLGVMIIQGVVKAYANRRIISLMWPAASITPFFYRNAVSSSRTALWVCLCVVMSAFTSLPTVQTVELRVVVLGGVLMCLVGLVHIVLRGGNVTMGAQVGLVCLTTLVTKESGTSLGMKRGLPFGCQVVGWFCLTASLLLPLCHRLERRAKAAEARAVHYQERLVILFLTFAPTFILLSVSYEGLFYLAFWALLVTWLHLESDISESLGHTSRVLHHPISPGTSSRGGASNNNSHNDSSGSRRTSSMTMMGAAEAGRRGLQFSDARVALFLFFLIQAAFFGTGNIASLSSFSLDSVYRLIPIFDPFLMSLLLLYKLLVPFAVLSAALGLLNEKLQVPKGSLFLTLLTFSDVLTVRFFWVVRDEGSWLEIGSSISAFVIAGLLVLFVISLERVSEWMVGDVVI